MKKFCIISLALMTFTIFSCYSVQKIDADSGWDSSYDSGSSDWGSSSSDWSSSSSDWSSSSSDYSSSLSYGSSSGGTFTGMPIFMAIFMELFCSIHYFVFAFRPLGSIFGKNDKQSMKIALILFAIRAGILVVLDIINPMFCIFDFIFLFILAFIVVPASTVFGKKNSSNTKNYTPSYNYQEVSDEVLQQYGITNKEEVKQKLFEQFVDIQNAWMNFDYHTLNLLLTDELYNMYVSQLDALKLKNEKNVMSNYERVDSKIYGISENNGIVTLKLYLNVKMYDYVVDYYNNVVRGNKNKKIDIKYNITFQKNINNVVNVCPNCGAKVEDNQTNCIYCNAKIVNSTDKFVMSKKECIGQK